MVIVMDLHQFTNIFPRAKNPNAWVQALNLQLDRYGFNTLNRISAFLAQTGHESAGYTALKENLNYSAQALNAVFPKYFKNAGRDANLYARQPEKIANVVYANRMGNGDTASGDGWKYRGRGLIQLTGKDNYQKFSNYISDPEIMKNPDLVSDDYNYAILSAIWFWNFNSLNVFADSGDMKMLTKRINGGYNGLDDRIKLYNKIRGILKWLTLENF